MNRLDDQTLLLYQLGELADEQAREVRLALQDDPALQAKLDELTALLSVMDHAGIPERDANYGRRVWARIEPELQNENPVTRLLRYFNVPVLAGVAVLVVAVSVSLLLPDAVVAPRDALPVSAAGTDKAGDRVLRASLLQHVEGSQRLILEFTNRVGTGVDYEKEREWAEILLMANRLYRFAAEKAGQPRIAQLLADMEPVLIELANSEHGLTDDEFNALRQRIEDNDLIFRMRGFSQGFAL